MVLSKTFLFFFCVLGFPIGLSPKTMQGLGSVQNFFVLGFPIGLSPRTMQGLGSVQNFFVLGFPIGLGPRTMQGLGSVQNFFVFLLQVSPLTMTGRADLGSEAPRDARAVGATGCKL